MRNRLDYEILLAEQARVRGTVTLEEALAALDAVPDAGILPGDDLPDDWSDADREAIARDLALQVEAERRGRT